MNLLDDIEVSVSTTGIYKGFEDQIFDIGEVNKLAIALKQGREQELIEYITKKIAEKPSYILSILDWSLDACVPDMGHLSRWIFTQDSFFPINKNLLNFGLRLSVAKWSSDGIKKFLSLGACPNQEVIPERNLYDICLNRSHHIYRYHFRDNADVVTDAIQILDEYNAKRYLIEKYETTIPCLNTLNSISIHDSWCEVFIKSIIHDDDRTQNLWCSLLNKCLNKAKKPSKKWLKDCKELVESIGVNSFSERAKLILKESHNSRRTMIYGKPEGLSSDSTKESFDLWKITESSSYILKSLMWLLMHINTKDSIETVFETCKVMYQTHYLLGIRDIKLAGACFSSLLDSEKGLTLAQSLFDEATHKPTINKMKILFNANKKIAG
ncbi:hypothetical protein [Microbulbifer sp. PAAF003]|uniref:hypothetical protein n=1 Tax=Microbulbifer sp. PAAF003 TaxID=3243375 RepID=UPI004039ACFB